MSVTFYTEDTISDYDNNPNLSNANAARVLELLGLRGDTQDELVGSDSAESFEGRVLLAQALTPADEGIPAHEIAGPGARWIECGRPVGYLQQRFEQLLDFAQAHRGETIHWA